MPSKQLVAGGGEQGVQLAGGGHSHVSMHPAPGDAPDPGPAAFCPEPEGGADMQHADPPPGPGPAAFCVAFIPDELWQQGVPRPGPAAFCVALVPKGPGQQELPNPGPAAFCPDAIVPGQQGTAGDAAFWLVLMVASQHGSPDGGDAAFCDVELMEPQQGRPDGGEAAFCDVALPEPQHGTVAGGEAAFCDDDETASQQFRVEGAPEVGPAALLVALPDDDPLLQGPAPVCVVLVPVGFRHPAKARAAATAMVMNILDRIGRPAMHERCPG